MPAGECHIRFVQNYQQLLNARFESYLVNQVYLTSVIATEVFVCLESCKKLIGSSLIWSYHEDMKTIITGTTQGLGLELAKLLADKEPIVINRRPTGLNEELIGDLSRKSDVEKLSQSLSEAIATQEEVTLVLNAALYGDDEAVSDVTAEALGELMYVNVFSQLSLVEALINKGIKVKLMAVSSQMGSISMAPEPYHYAYSVSKAALNLSVRLMKTQYDDKLDYLLVDPGWMATQMGGDDAPDKPEVVAANIIKAMADESNWNNSHGMLKVNTGDINTW